jgi:hypothetical protein
VWFSALFLLGLYLMQRGTKQRGPDVVPELTRGACPSGHWKIGAAARGRAIADRPRPIRQRLQPGDGTSDILFQNSDGEIAIWGMNGGQVAGEFDVGNPGPDWHAVATGDLGGTGTPQPQ